MDVLVQYTHAHIADIVFICNWRVRDWWLRSVTWSTWIPNLLNITYQVIRAR